MNGAGVGKPKEAEKKLDSMMDAMQKSFHFKINWKLSKFPKVSGYTEKLKKLNGIILIRE